MNKIDNIKNENSLVGKSSENRIRTYLALKTLNFLTKGLKKSKTEKKIAVGFYACTKKYFQITLIFFILKPKYVPVYQEIFSVAKTENFKAALKLENEFFLKACYVN
ncbi:hypothetical protein BpHYR1_022807 [Brachionus plicatilis]|uniref:Uncharacterized protein n=1 Tax=Brachionus plicatilis TaxID=10195 RepID=A0A3M7SYQ2_BRAPC|nr:hypothetical protein BpHYR1_022807 [Brachionus plicatilis]